jgi:two-component system, OmpR family, phosphate regulon sensor histidine kinase PhoR
MSISTRRGARLRLPVWFIVLAAIPLGALGWLGYRLLVQERGLEQQQQRGRLEDAATTFAHALDRALARWEDALPAVASGGPVSLPSGVVAVGFDQRGIQHRLGPPLAYEPVLPESGEEASDLFKEIETLEFARDDLIGAEAAYRRLSATSNKKVRAEALMRLARCLRKEQRAEDALPVYDALVEMRETTIAGAPSELVARRERIALSSQIGRADDAAQESNVLAAVLLSGRYRIDRATFDFYRESSSMPATLRGSAALARGVDDVWTLSGEQPTGRISIKGDGDPLVAVWRRTPAGTGAIVGRLDTLIAASDLSTRDGLSVSLEDPSGNAVWGAPAGSGSVRTGHETGLPWTVRVESADATSTEPLALRRRNLLIAGFALMALVVTAASYAVFRAVNQELSVARLQSDFVATVSHEFRTPLTAMRHLTEMLEDGHASPDRVPQYYNALGKETRRLQTLVESLLDFGRMEAGRRTYQMEDTSAAEIAERVIEEFAGSPAVSRIEWLGPDSTSNGDRHLIRADPGAMALALRNLLDNALKYSPESAPVRLSVYSDRDSMRIAVADAGPGIPRREHRDIFRKFVRGTTATARNVKGTGIGLAIADHIVRDHGGRLQLESEPGRGSCFTIVLPFEARRA